MNVAVYCEGVKREQRHERSERRTRINKKVYLFVLLVSGGVYCEGVKPEQRQERKRQLNNYVKMNIFTNCERCRLLRGRKA